MRKLTIAALFVFWPACALADVTGIYAASDATAATIIHIVESADGALRGQVEFIEIDSSNDVKTSSRNLTGTARRNAVAITMDMPIVNWFSSTTLTGSVGGNVLSLSFSGETIKFQKVTAARYAQIKRHITLAAEVRKHQALVASANRHYAELSKNVETLIANASGEAAWFQQAKQDYAALFAEDQSLEKQRRAYLAIGADQSRLIQVENRQYELKSMIWDLDSKAQTRAAKLRDLRMRIESSAQKLKALCGDSGLRDAEAACSGWADIKPQFQSAMSKVRTAFDALASYRETIRI